MEKKLILIDFNNMCYQVVFSKFIFEKYNQFSSDELDDNFVDDLYKDSLKMIMQKIINIVNINRKYIFNIMFARDNKKIWRREKFPEYKIHRKAIRDKSKIDFSVIYDIFDKIWVELQNLPMKFINIEGVECDDIIYTTILIDYNKYDVFEIISTDSDFLILLKYDKVKIYNTRTMSYSEVESPEYELFEKIIVGDKSDNIPNILSSSRNEKQPTIRRKKIKEWFNDKELFKNFLLSQNKNVRENFIRNTYLIDMKYIPDNIKEIIKEKIKIESNDFDLCKLLKMDSKYKLNLFSVLEVLERNGRY